MALPQGPDNPLRSSLHIHGYHVELSSLLAAKGAKPKGLTGLWAGSGLLTKPCALVEGYLGLKERIPSCHFHKGAIWADENLAFI